MWQYIIETNNPSMIGPDELLTVRFPDLKENQVIIKKTTKLIFNISLSGTDANTWLTVSNQIVKSLSLCYKKSYFFKHGSSYRSNFLQGDRND